MRAGCRLCYSIHGGHRQGGERHEAGSKLSGPRRRLKVSRVLLLKVMNRAKQSISPLMLHRANMALESPGAWIRNWLWHPGFDHHSVEPGTLTSAQDIRPAWMLLHCWNSLHRAGIRVACFGKAIS